MDGADLALAVLVAYVPALLWLACGVAVGAGKRALATVRTGFVRDSGSPPNDPENEGSVAGPSLSSVVSDIFFDVFLVASDTALNVARFLFSNISLIVLFWGTLVVSTILLHRNEEVLFVIDTFYEAMRPTTVETFLHVVNFARVVYALFVGVWNALIEIILVPIRLLLDSAFRCGGVEFVRDVAIAASDIARAVAFSMRDFFVRYYEEKTLDVDVTEVVRASRLFLQEFAQVIECSCASIAGPMIRAAGHPLYSSTTDVFINNATRSVVKAFEIPYVAATTGSTSFAPLFEVILSERDGVLKSGARLGNEYLKEVVDYVQGPIPADIRFETPPLFTLIHRFIAIFVEMARGIVDTVAEIPTLAQSRGSVVSDTLHTSATGNRVKYHANQFVKVLFTDTLTALHPYFQEYGEALTTGAEVLIELTEVTYNSTLDAVTGISSRDETVAPARNFSKGVSECESYFAYSDDPVTRPRMAINLWVHKYSTHVVPLQISFFEKVRKVIAFKFFSVAFADTFLAGTLALTRAFEAVLKLTAYLTDSLIRFDYVSRLCTDAFTQDAWQKIDDLASTLTALITSLQSYEDTYASGYANIACARTNHVNHVYSGSLKAYVFAANSCRAKFTPKDEETGIQAEGFTGTMPKCPYRDDDKDVESKLCEKLTAFSEYNSNPLCNTGDAVSELLRSINLIQRTYVDYYFGLLVGVWNCMIDAGKLDFEGCAESLAGEIVPSDAVFDLLQCQTAELVYRVSSSVVSSFTPLFDVVYLKTGYPKKGFYSKGADDLQHVQARPLEAAMSTVFSAFGGVVFYPVHVLSILGRDICGMIRDTATGSFDISGIFAYRQTFVVVVLRTVVLFFTDLLISFVEFSRAVDVITNYKVNADCHARGECGAPDPKVVTSEFETFQKAVGDIVGLIQDISALFSETFVAGVEAFFDMIFYLLEALMKMALGDASAGDSLVTFIETFVEQIGSLIVDLIQGIFRFLVKDYDSGFPNPFRILFCDVLGALKNGVCDFMDVEFIPTRLNIVCFGRTTGCKWLTNGKIEFFKTPSGSSETLDGLDEPDKTSAFSDTTGSRALDDAGYRGSIDGVNNPYSHLDDVTSDMVKKWFNDFVKSQVIPVYKGKQLNVGELTYLLEKHNPVGLKFATEYFNGRRHLLGGEAQFIRKVMKPITDPIEDLANEAVEGVNKIAKGAENLANKALDYAKAAVDGVVDTANKAVNAANRAWDWIKDIADTIKESIPDASRWTAEASSIKDFTPNGYRTMGCENRGMPFCDANKGEKNQRMDPTVCSSEVECHATNAYCWTTHWDTCLSRDFASEGGEEWAMSCRCDLLVDKKYHCNYASGFCEAGVTPFAPPLDECSSSGGLVAGSDGYDRLCYISPIWKCADHPDPEHCRTLIGGELLQLQGPSLCRSFCDPTWENRNNRLTQVEFADGTRKCVCEVGFDRTFPDASASSSTFDTVKLKETYDTAKGFVSGVTGRRMLQEHPSSARRPFTACTSTSQCVPSFSSPTICRSIWGDPTPCYSCSERKMGETRGYACDPEEKECACTIERDQDVGDERLMDVGEWRGNGWCDKIMRGYKTSAVRTPLERAWIHRCTVYKLLGQQIVSFLGVPAIPPDILYNPGRLLSVLVDVIQGVNVYYKDGFHRENLEVAFFDRLVEMHIEPTVVFRALEVFDKMFKIVQIVYEKIDLVAFTSGVLAEINPKAELAFTFAVEKTSGEMAKVYNSSSGVNYTELFVGTAAVASRAANMARETYEHVKNISAEKKENSSSLGSAFDIPETTTEVLNVSGVPETTTEVLNVSGVVASTRSLLQVAECQVIENVRDRASEIGNTLARYYGEQKFLLASLCAYQTYLTGDETCPTPGGQANENESRISLKNPFPFVEGVSITRESVIGFIFDSSNAVIRELDMEPEELVKKIVSSSGKASNTVTRCSPEIILCERKKMSLASALWIAESWAFGAFISFKLLGVTSLGLGTFITAQMTVIPAAVLYLSYGYSSSCFPRLPVCLMDDFFVVLRRIMPRHIDWSTLVTNPVRESHPTFGWLYTIRGETDSIIDCRESGFRDQLDVYFWLGSRVGLKELFSIIDWPLLALWPRARREKRNWRDIERTNVVDDCGYLLSVGAIPVILLSFLFYVVLSFMTVPIVRTGARTLKRVKETIVLFFLATLGIYNE